MGICIWQSHTRSSFLPRFILSSGGYPAVILDRPAFYDILLKNLPKSKILYGKRVTEIEQDDNGATVRCADGRYAPSFTLSRHLVSLFCSFHCSFHSHLFITGAHLICQDKTQISVFFLGAALSTPPPSPSPSMRRTTRSKMMASLTLALLSFLPVI